MSTGGWVLAKEAWEGVNASRGSWGVGGSPRELSFLFKNTNISKYADLL